MYNGIEIEHPVFRVLLCNLIVAFFSSAVNLIAHPIKNKIKYNVFVNTNNAFSLLFHCCCWLIVSLLRFIYIFHKDWLFKRFPEPKTLNRLVIASVFFAYILCLLTIVIVCMLCGWPRVMVFEMPMPQKAIAVGTLFGILILLICFSCSFYLLILRKRGRLRNNKIGINISEVKDKGSDIEMTTSQFGNVWIGDPHKTDTFHQENHRQDSMINVNTFY
jgi:hypothetical protein